MGVNAKVLEATILENSVHPKTWRKSTLVPQNSNNMCYLRCHVLSRLVTCPMVLVRTIGQAFVFAKPTECYRHALALNNFSTLTRKSASMMSHGYKPHEAMAKTIIGHRKQSSAPIIRSQGMNSAHFGHVTSIKTSLIRVQITYTTHSRSLKSSFHSPNWHDKR